jgi:orotate phosphoribosyltransferase
MNANRAIELGLLKFPPPGTVFPSRGSGNTGKAYVIDARGAGSCPELRRIIVEALLEHAAGLPTFDIFAGISKSGTVWAAWCAWAAGYPFANVLLDGPRASGLQREVEGDVTAKRVLLVDNWVRSGDSIAKAADVVTRAGGIPVAALTVVRNGNVNLALPLASAWAIAELLDAAQAEGLWRPGVTYPQQSHDFDSILTTKKGKT